MKALITGGAGFAGSHLAEYLLRQGQEVSVFVRERDNLCNLQHILSEICIERGDLRDADRLYEVLKYNGPKRIYHLAAVSSPVESFRDPRLAYEVNFTGTFNLLSAWRSLETDSRFLYVSSSEVYGVVSDASLPLREDSPLRPASPYAGSKAAAELLALQFFQSYGLPIVRVRPFNHTGPRQSSAFVCSSFARQIAEIDFGFRPPVVNVGNIKLYRDFSDVRDIVRGYYLLLDRGEPGDVYQLCSGRSISIEAILQGLLASASKPIRVTVDESKLRTEESPALWGDPSKARQTVGWEPQRELQATLRDLKRYWADRIQRRAVNCLGN